MGFATFPHLVIPPTLPRKLSPDITFDCARCGYPDKGKVGTVRSHELAAKSVRKELPDH
jgi:hypothetical protein